MGCLQQKSDGCHFGTLGRIFYRQKQNGRHLFLGQIFLNKLTQDKTLQV